MSVLIGKEDDEALRQKWLRERREYVTSTDVSILFGKGYSGSSPTKLYGQKQGIIPEDPPSMRMKLGILFEPGIRTVYEEEFKRRVTTMPRWTLIQSKEFPWLAASIDGIDDLNRISEIKLSDYYSDTPKEAWVLQVQTQMMVLDKQEAVIVVCQNGVEIKEFLFDRDKDLQDEILEKSQTFHNRLVTKSPPPPEFAEDNSGLSALYKYVKVPGQSVTLPEDFELLADQREGLSVAIRQAYQEKDLLEAQVKFSMGDAEIGFVGDTGGQFKWKADKNGKRSLRFYKAKGAA